MPLNFFSAEFTKDSICMTGRQQVVCLGKLQINYWIILSYKEIDSDSSSVLTPSTLLLAAVMKKSDRDFADSFIPACDKTLSVTSKDLSQSFSYDMKMVSGGHVDKMYL